MAMASRRSCGAAHVLRLAVVGLQPGEPQGGVLADLVRQGHGRLARRDAAAALADVDLHENVDHGGCAILAARLVHRLGQPGHALGAVHGDRQLPVLGRDLVRQRRHPRQLVRGDHLVADVDVVDAAGDHGLGLGGFLHAHAHGAGLHLQLGQRRRSCASWRGAASARRASSRIRPCGARLRFIASRSTTRAGVSMALTLWPTSWASRDLRKWCFRRRLHGPDAEYRTSLPE